MIIDVKVTLIFQSFLEKLFTDSSGNPELGCGVYFNGL
jgi:hypothetical protein